MSVTYSTISNKPINCLFPINFTLFSNLIHLVHKRYLGRKETIRQAIDIAGYRSNVVFFGLPDTNRDVPFNYAQFFMKQVQMYGVVDAQSEKDLKSFYAALDWSARREIDVSNMVSHRLPLESIDQALILANERDEDALKVTLTF